MSLMNGDRIGAYQITGALGAGAPTRFGVHGVRGAVRPGGMGANPERSAAAWLRTSTSALREPVEQSDDPRDADNSSEQEKRARHHYLCTQKARTRAAAQKPVAATTATDDTSKSPTADATRIAPEMTFAASGTLSASVARCRSFNPSIVIATCCFRAARDAERPQALSARLFIPVYVSAALLVAAAGRFCTYHGGRGFI